MNLNSIHQRAERSRKAGTSRLMTLACGAGLLLGAGQSALIAATPVEFTTGSAVVGYYPSGPSGPLGGAWREGNVAPVAGVTIADFALTIDVTSYNSQPVSWDPTVTFCAELQQSIELGTSYPLPTEAAFQREAVAVLDNATAGTAKSAGIDTGGVGTQKATYLQILFNQAYAGTTLSAWTADTAGAFQLAVWKLTHEPLVAGALSITTLDLGASDPGGAHFGWYGTDPTVPSTGFYTAAQTLVDNVLAAYPTYNPADDVWELMALTDDVHQDLITVFQVPEPEFWALGSGLGLMLLVGLRRWRHGRSAD